MEQNVDSRVAIQNTLVMLPVEVLVYIVSFLSACDKVRIRCVSRILYSVSEVPSLWEEFTWSHYAARDYKLLVYILRMFGKHVKKIQFTDHIAPSQLEIMLRHCKNATQLNLPSFLYLRNFYKFERIVHNMACLQILDIRMPNRDSIHQIFMLCSNLKELSLHDVLPRCFIPGFNGLQQWLEEWAEVNYTPRKLNIIFDDKPGQPNILISDLQRCLPILRNKMLVKISDSAYTGWFSICFRGSDFSPVIPLVQLQVTDSSVVIPLVKASKYGILGLDHDMLHITEGSHRGKKVYKALLINGIDDYVDTSVTSLTFVTYFAASYCTSLYPGHLEQISVACPNLQRLDLCGKSDCLSNLQGLNSLANNCKSLQGLNLMGIHVKDREYNCLQLWEILCMMHLNQLAIEAWMINIHDKRNVKLPSSSLGDCKVPATMQQKLINIFQKYSSLQVLEVEASIDGECSCKNLSDNELSLISYFPSIISYRLCNMLYGNCYHALKEIFSCKYLRCLYLFKNLFGILSLTLEGHCSSLQQLYIYSRDTVPMDTFIDTLCGHGGLEHVILCVKSLTARSIRNIIKYSSNLVTFHIVLCSRAFLKAELKNLIATIKTRFSKRKLFNGGSFDIRQVPYHSISAEANDSNLIFATDLLSVWDSNDPVYN